MRLKNNKYIGVFLIGVFVFCGFNLTLNNIERWHIKADSVMKEEKPTELYNSVVDIVSKASVTAKPIMVKKKKITKVDKMDKLGYAKSDLNIREKPSTDSDIKGMYLVGEKVNIKGEIDGWYETDKGFVSSKYISFEKYYYRCEATAYANPHNNKTADCSDTIEGITLAGRKEWLGRSCRLYKCNSDGTVGVYLGSYEFHDTGWGIDGDIPRGETIDIFMESEQDCRDWGRQNVLVEFIE